MSYYNDARDVLESAYPTCTSFLRYHAQPTVAGLRRRACGVAIVLAFDSPGDMSRFKRVCYSLEDSAPWNRFCFDVYDFEGIVDVLPLLASFGTIRGAGELFLINQGKIVGAVTGHFDPIRFDELTDNLFRLNCQV